MKTLVLVRHAKSDWGGEGLKDIDRPLNERGYDDAYRLSEWFFKNHHVPQKFISSDATRAFSTAAIFARNLAYPANDILIDPQIYESTSEILKKVIANIDNSFDYVALFGHNPGITNLVNDLTQELFFDNIPTCGIVCLEFDVKDWKDIATKKAKKVFNQFPKEFK